jgi:hypothetical protein
MFRDWIAAGAKDDSGKGETKKLPEIKRRGRPAASLSALAYQPDGKVLAVGGYQEVLLLDVGRQEVIGRLPGQTGAVTALAFSRDGRRFAVASGTSGAAGEVRIYDLTGGNLNPVARQVIAAHADIVHDLVFSPDGKTLATAGYDRLIKIWDVETGQELRTLRDHSDSIYALAFSPDGNFLVSVSADRAVKVWEVASGRRLYTLSDATDWLYAVAFSPDGKHLAAGGVDRSIRVWEVNAEGGRLVQSAFAHEGPIVRLAYSRDGKTLYSLGEDRVAKAWTVAPLTEKRVYEKQPETVLSLAVSADGKQIALGRYDGALVLLDEATGKVAAEPLPVKPKAPGQRFPPAEQKPGNDTPTRAQEIALPATVVGAIDRAGRVDFYRFDMKAGQQVGVHAVPADTRNLDPVLVLTDSRGNILAEGNRFLGHTCRDAQTCILSIRDRDYRGGNLDYRLDIGEVPIVSAVFPLGLQRGTEVSIRVEGVHLGDVSSVTIKAAPDATIGGRVPLPIETPFGPPLGAGAVVVGEFPEVIRGTTGEVAVIPVPGTGNGQIDRPGEAETWTFSAKKGETLIVEVEARRLGSPLDSVIEILDAAGRPVPRGVLRCLARTFTTLRDHDALGPGIRLESWNELAINDYILIGSELLRIRELPRHPDADTMFVAVNNQRVGQLDTTPTHHVLGAPVYKVGVHPPGTTFPPNGYPVVTLYYRNDDGGPGYGKDSRIFFDPPADGVYQVRVGDSRGFSGRAYSYRLTVRPPRPGYQVSFNPTTPSVWSGGAVPIAVTADRIDGFDDAIEIRLENLPPGFSAPATTIPAGETTTAFALFADAKAVLADKAANLKLIAKARIKGHDVVREAAGGKPQLVPSGDIVTKVDRDEISVIPGRTVKLTVAIERRNKFTGRVPLDVRGLPHGVRVLDIGLNGILITEKDTSRTIEIYCEPWVQPQDHPIVVLARREGKNTEHAARSVLLRVAREGGATSRTR